jgi:hypothetical protein
MASPGKRTSEVFGISNTVLPGSYVDRGELDAGIRRLLDRPIHIALRGESKCGKSWLRQRTIPNALVVQCRLGKSVVDLYVDALSQLGVRLELEQSAERKLRGRVEAHGEAGIGLLAKVGIRLSSERESTTGARTEKVGHDVNDLRFIADLIRASERRLVIEDFHYMSVAERKKFAFDLKALWDYGLFVVVVGVWSQSNMLLYLNPDLTGRVQELEIYWTEDDLGKVLSTGGAVLNIDFAPAFTAAAAAHCYGNVGIVQALILGALDVLKIFAAPEGEIRIHQKEALETAAMEYAEQLNPLYQQFANRVSNGMRRRQDTTGIYAHAMAVVLDAPDEQLIRGLSIDYVYERAHARQNRIQKGNLQTVLRNFESLQVDEDGRGLVLSFNEATGEISVVDRQLLLYRRYSTVKWPWEDMIAEIEREKTEQRTS